MVRASPLEDSIEVDRCTSDVRFHPRCRKPLALLLPVAVERLHRAVWFPPYLEPLTFLFFVTPELYGSDGKPQRSGVFRATLNNRGRDPASRLQRSAKQATLAFGEPD